MSFLSCGDGSVLARRAARRSERGSAILGIVALMLLVGLLGVTLLTHIAGSSQGTLVTDGGNRAFFLAESGGRYAITRILQQGEAAVAELDGRRFTLANGDAFDLAIENQHLTGVERYCIDSTGISGLGTAVERHALNGYIIDVVEPSDVVAPVAFAYGAQLTGTTAVTLSGSSYIDSYDSRNPATAWTTRGQYTEASVSVNRDEDAASLAWGAGIYGDLYVGADADPDHPEDIVNRPNNITGEIIPAAAPSAPAVPPPAEAAEVAAPSPLASMPAFATWGSQTLPGGNYRTTADFANGSANLTLTSSSYVAVGDDLEITSGGSISVNGDFAARVNDDMNVRGGINGLTIQGAGDLDVRGDLTISNGSRMSVGGALDLDVAGDFELVGNSRLVLSGDADIDVAGSFNLSNGSVMQIDGDVVLRVGDGFTIGGSGSAPIIFTPGSSLQVYVQSGAITLASFTGINAGGPASRFLVFGSTSVSTVTVSGDAAVYAGIYAPAAAVSISGSSALFGAVVARSLTLGGTSALHYDQALEGINTVVPQESNILRRLWVAAGE